jgi:hypothetical protein
VNDSDSTGDATCPRWLPGCGVVTNIQNGGSALYKWANNQVNAAVCQYVQQGGLLSGYLEQQAGCGSAASTSVTSSSHPLAAGALAPGSTADAARAAADGAGFKIPSDYVARPADKGKGWVFSPPGAEGDSNAIRVMEPTSIYSDGYVRTYNVQGYPTDAQGKQIGSKGVGQAETHFPLPKDPFEG